MYHHLPITETFIKGNTYKFKFHLSGVELYREFRVYNYLNYAKKGFYLACK